MAKFKKGDKVTGGNAVYEITDVDDGVYKWRPVGGKGDPSYSEGGEVEWAERKMRLANARACNGKFKVGDVVSVKREAAEMIDNPALARKRGRVTKVLPGGYYEVDGELGATGLELTDAELILANACRSTNAVVANAMAANARMARNAEE